ncbi:DUF2334 domain-containing protein [bacterium]|nr:DUF2334 domain-containing protein [bacterium]
MQIKWGQILIDTLRGKNLVLFRLAKLYINYKKSIKHIKDFAAYKVIFKLDDLVNCNEAVLELDRYIKREDLKVCWGIIGNSLESADNNYLNFIKENNNKNYQFFNHGYNHLEGPEYEFCGKSVEEQIDTISKTQKIVYDKTGITLRAFGAPCNRIDDNTTAALETFKDIKYWFYGKNNYSGISFLPYTRAEKTVGNPDFEFLIENLSDSDKNMKILILQFHPYHWDFEQKINFHLIIKFLKKLGCEFIFPDEAVQQDIYK